MITNRLHLRVGLSLLLGLIWTSAAVGDGPLFATHIGIAVVLEPGQTLQFLTAIGVLILLERVRRRQRAPLIFLL